MKLINPIIIPPISTFTITKCGCSSLVPIYYTSEFTQNPVKSLGIQGHLLL